MYLPIEQMPDDSRVWVYQANRKFTVSEIEFITTAVTSVAPSFFARSKQYDALDFKYS